MMYRLLLNCVSLMVVVVGKDWRKGECRLQPMKRYMTCHVLWRNMTIFVQF